jgi:hypothetical protein
MQAMQDHKERLKRSVNVFTLCRGRFAQEEQHDGDATNDAITNDDSTDNNNSSNNNNNKALFPPPQPHCRTYLSLLTQLGSLHLTRKNYASARSSFLTAIELEGYHHSTSITNARTQLMNMYLSTNRPDSARKLFNSLSTDSSAWIRYSAALIEYVSWNLLGEDGSSRDVAEKALGEAILGNVYVAYMIGWKDVFDRAMEYTEDVVDWGDGELGSVLEAVEYYGCGCLENEEEEENERGLAVWLGTEGSLDWVRSFVLRVLANTAEGGNGDGEDYGNVRSALLGWETRLASEEEVYEKEKALNKELESDDNIMESGNNEEEEEEEPDLLMYAGMFRTAMDWLQDAGEFKKSPVDDYIVTVAASDDGKEKVVDTPMTVDDQSDSDSSAGSRDSNSSDDSNEE